MANKGKKSKEIPRNPAIDARADPTVMISRAYILALSLIAILMSAGHIVTANLTEQQKIGADISNQISKQRTLAQQTMLYATNYLRTNEPLDKSFMLQFTWEFEKSHKFITEMITNKSLFQDTSSPALQRMYFRPPFNLDEQVLNYLNMVKAYSEYDPATQDPQRVAERKELLERITRHADTILRPGLDAAFENYQTENVESIAHYYSMQLSGALFILLVLVGEALFIFRPLIKRIRKHHQIMQRFALEDALTGLNNRRAFMNSAETELMRAKREKTAVTVALMDLDHFKSVNDTYGHEVGDNVLKHFAGLMKESMRGTDIFGRIGGEEFAIVLPRIDKDGALKILERFCQKVASTPCEYIDSNGEHQALSYSVSIGFTGPSILQTDETVDKLLSFADTALYKAKEKGRNCVVSDS